MADNSFTVAGINLRVLGPIDSGMGDRARQSEATNKARSRPDG